jgi:hypothetical protein
VSISGKGNRVKFKFLNATAKLMTKVFAFIMDYKTQKARYS